MIKEINNKISYIENGKNPLSSDVIVIKCNDITYLFDVGANGESLSTINDIKGKKEIIISHFHQDHSENLANIKYSKLYTGKYTRRHIKCELNSENIIEVEDAIYIATDDGGSISIYPIPSSHAKGCLCMEVDEEYLFVGDAIYPMYKDGKRVYNQQFLKSQIDFLEKINAEKLFLSHDKKPIVSKEVIVAFLKSIYEKREKDNPYIVTWHLLQLLQINFYVYLWQHILFVT